MKVLLAVLFSFQALASLDNQPAFSYEDCMTSGDNRELQRSACNLELRQSLLTFASSVHTQFEEQNTQVCDSKEDTMNSLDIYYQYVAHMKYGALDSSGLTENQIVESMSRIKTAQSQITTLCN